MLVLFICVLPMCENGEGLNKKGGRRKEKEVEYHMKIGVVLIPNSIYLSKIHSSLSLNGNLLPHLIPIYIVSQIIIILGMVYNKLYLFRVQYPSIDYGIFCQYKNATGKPERDNILSHSS